MSESKAELLSTAELGTAVFVGAKLTSCHVVKSLWHPTKREHSRAYDLIILWWPSDNFIYYGMSQNLVHSLTGWTPLPRKPCQESGEPGIFGLRLSPPHSSPSTSHPTFLSLLFRHLFCPRPSDVIYSSMRKMKREQRGPETWRTSPWLRGSYWNPGLTVSVFASHH